MRPTLLRAVLSACFLIPSLVSGQTFVWTGATNGSWATGSNWDAGVPTSGATTVLTFNTATTLTTTHDIGGGLTLNQLNLGPSAGARTITGNALTFDGVSPALIDQATAGHVTLANALVLPPTLTVTGGPAESAQFFLDGTVSGSGGLTFTSGFTLLTGANTFTGATVVENAAQLGLSRTGALGTSSGISVGPSAHLQIIRTNSTTATTINRPLALAGLLSSASLKVNSLGFAVVAATYSGAITLSGNAEIRAFGATGTGFNSVELGISGTRPRVPVCRRGAGQANGGSLPPARKTWVSRVVRGAAAAALGFAAGLRHDAEARVAATGERDEAAGGGFKRRGLF
jgi:hypothetical protein